MDEYSLVATKYFYFLSKITRFDNKMAMEQDGN